MRNRYSIIILFIALGFMGVGTFRGEVQVVLMKGINLCLECVGIG
ncbi:CD1871A family CXXC motif-containing protein [Clostridium estertheticum]|nr:CD1871A family CXXC motif-containing protein [Clostridium estertheticum]